MRALSPLVALAVTLALVGPARLARAEGPPDTAKDSKAVYDTAMAHYNAAEKEGGIFAKLWRIVDSTAHDNLVNSKDHFVEAKAAVDKQLKAGEVVEAELKLQNLKEAAADLETEITAYRKETKSTVWKLEAGIAIFVLGLIGMAVWSRIRRRR